MDLISVPDLSYNIVKNDNIIVQLESNISDSSLAQENTLYEITVEPLYGAITVEDNKITYIHNGTNTITDIIKYKAINADNESNEGIIRIVVYNTLNDSFINDITIRLSNENRRYILQNNFGNYDLVYRFINNETGEIISSINTEVGKLTIQNDYILLFERELMGQSNVTLRVYKILNVNNVIINDEFLQSLSELHFKDVVIHAISDEMTNIINYSYDTYSKKLTMHESNRFYKEAYYLFNKFKNNATEYQKINEPYETFANDILVIVQLLVESTKLYKHNQETITLFKEVIPYANKYRAYNSTLDYIIGII